jgi:hypothetical protein
MKTKILLAIATITVFITGCCDKPENSKDYIIFGDFYGECLGSGCVDYYKIENGVLYKDQLDQYPSTGITHQFELYTGTYNPAMLDLVNEVPSNIYTEGEMIGTPDSYDQGGYFLEINNSGTIQKWEIDKNTSSVPSYLHAVCDSMQHYLEDLD